MRWHACVALQYPVDLIQQLMATGADIAAANCVYLDGSGTPTERMCDEGAWAETPESRAYIAKLAPDVPLFEAYPCEFSLYLLRSSTSDPRH
jgi:hypothetical protein